MADLVEMIKNRQEQSKKSIEEYANLMGIRQATLSRYYKLERKISIDVVQRLAGFYRSQGDEEMLQALADYALGDGGQSPS